ncbi:hypothetical protein X768_23310 [Mesorhizobium sp. LSJC265A00]|nr:hypothetical protein X768_23310 [Mesorhizobium sp. LSJC265A00]ESZ56318.1 hypothetical protein X728_26260 [Mesorhizobium sp. L103C120A0]
MKRIDPLLVSFDHIEIQRAWTIGTWQASLIGV